MAAVQPHVGEEAAETASATVLTATTDAGPQQAPYTIIVSDPLNRHLVNLCIVGIYERIRSWTFELVEGLA